jgi:hypothetical protein
MHRWLGRRRAEHSAEAARNVRERAGVRTSCVVFSEFVMNTYAV